jgi:hypothetical protein
LREAYDWYEDQQTGLGKEFAREFLQHHRELVSGPELYAIRFAEVRRLNLYRFPYGLFYTIREKEIWLPVARRRLCLPNAGSTCAVGQVSFDEPGY